MALNEAGQANFDELDSNVRLLGVRVRATEGAARERALEDLEDTHERALQLRIMHNNTLTAELEEKKTALEEAKAAIAKHERFRRLLNTTLAAAVTGGVGVAFPDAATVVLEWANTIPVAVLLTAIITTKVCRSF